MAPFLASDSNASSPKFQFERGSISVYLQMDDDLTARISMADARFSFQDHTKVSKPNWMSPESMAYFS